MMFNLKSRMPMTPGLQQIIMFDMLYFNDNEKGREVLEPMIGKLRLMTVKEFEKDNFN